MSDTGKIAFLLIAALVVITTMGKSNHEETFTGVPQAVYLDNESELSSVAAPFTGGRPKSHFFSRGTAEPHLAPRMMSIGYSGKIRGPEPPSHLQAVPAHPVDYSNMSGFAGVERYGDDALNGYTQEEVDKMVYDKHLKTLEYTNPEDLLPVGDMEHTIYGKHMSDPNTYTYDRMILTNAKRRNHAGADRIRGDLPIKPNYFGWFDTHAKPHIDLVAGAIGTHIGPGYDIERDGPDTTITNQRGSHGLQFRRMP